MLTVDLVRPESEIYGALESAAFIEIWRVVFLQISFHFRLSQISRLFYPTTYNLFFLPLFFF